MTPQAGSTSSSSTRPLLLLLGVEALVAGWCASEFFAWHWADAPGFAAPLHLTRHQARLAQGAAAVLVLSAVVIALALRRAPWSVRRWAPACSATCLTTAALLVFAARAPLFPPQEIVARAIRFRHTPAMRTRLEGAEWLFGGIFAGLLSLTLIVRPRRMPRTPSRSYGSAHWGSGVVLGQRGGFELGRLEGRVLRYAGDGHLITIAPTRTGKGIGAVIPNLLHYPGSVVVTDPKGENHAVTARRRRELGSCVYAFDPFDAVDGTAAFNPLDLVDAASPDANDDAWMLADMLVVPKGREGEHAFWNEEARALLAGLILHVAANAPPELRNLTHVRELLTLPPDPFQLLLKDMLESEAAGGLVTRAAARLLQKADRERSGVISSAQSHTHFLDSPRMATVMGASSVDLAALKRECMSIYLVLPPDRMDTYRPWLRLMIACSLLAMTRTPGRPRERVLFLLDEFANLGRMQPVERDISLAGAYGTSFWLLLQDLAQLKSTYDKWQSFLANADVLQAFGVNDWETAEYLSRMTGEATIQVASENVSRGVTHGRHGTRQESSAETTSERGRRLLMADEVRRLGNDTELLFVRGSAPLLAQKLNYLRDTEYAGLADRNPMHDPPLAVPAVATSAGRDDAASSHHSATPEETAAP